MNAVAVAEDVRLHPRVPAVGLVAEMCAGFEQLLHRDDGAAIGISPSGYASADPSNRTYVRHRYE